MNPLLLAFYGDDFTGSTDSMETLEWNGVPTALFLEPPTPEFLREHFPFLRAVGVAGVSRTMTPAEMDDALPPIFEAIQALGANVFHYKVCSTFDSAPTIGSIGRASEIALGIFGEQLVPLVVGAPFLRRYVAFSNLFARVEDVTYRLDRHPTMSQHPSTPMNEADLRLHLDKQTTRTIGTVNLLHLEQPLAQLDAYVDRLAAEGVEIAVFDTISDEHLRTIGALLDARIRRGATSLLVGSSGIQRALALHWQASQQTEPPAPLPELPPVKQMIVVSGSASPATAGQIEWAIANGYAGIRLNAPRLIDPATADAERAATTAEALAALAEGRSVVLYSAQGPHDPFISETRAHLAALKLDPQTVGSRLGTQQGLILRDLLEQTGLRRVVVAGGDTCGYAARQLGIYALRAVMPVAPGAPLCRAYSHDSRFDGLQILLKGGQFGNADFFGIVQQGSH